MLKQLFGSSSHWQVNKDFAKSFGIECAVLMIDLVDKWLYFQEKETDAEWFYNTHENITQDTTLSKYQTSKAIMVLKNAGFVECELKGLPARLHFKINENNLLNFFTQLSKKNKQQDVKKINNLKSKNLTTYNKNKDNKNKEIKINNNTNIIPAKNFSNFDGSQKESIINDKNEIGVYNKVLDIYYKFHEKQTGVVNVITSKDGKKIKELIAFCELNTRRKHGEISNEQKDIETVNAVQWIFNNYDKWGNAYHKSLKLEMIVSNISDIINNIKNGITKSKNGTRASASNLEESVRANDERIREIWRAKKG